MNRRLVLLALVLCTVAIAGRSASADTIELLLDPYDYRVGELRSLHADISLANTLNGLGLTVDQLAQLRDIAYRADDARERYRVTLEPVFAEMNESSQALKICLLEEGTAAEAIIKRVELATRDYQYQRTAFEQDLLALEQEIEQVLDANQVELMEGARPCVRPPDELSPVRVGQAGGAGSKMIERLTGMREMDDASYERSKQRMIDKSVDRRVARTGPMSEDDEAALRAEMAAAIDAVRALDDLTWQVDGQAAADRLHRLFQLKPDRPDRPRERKPGELGRASEVLLAPGASDVIASILERREAE